MSIAGTLKAKAVAKQASDSLQGASSFGNTRIQATIGTQKSQSNSSSYTEVNHASNITTNNLALIATGGGTDSNININGSNLNVTNDALFQADNDFNINGVAQNSNTRSDNSSSSAAIGGYASTGSGVGITASASKGKGYANSDSVTYADSQVNVGGTTTFDIGNDVNIKGGVINTNKAQGQILGDVNIESLQDTATYDSNQKNIGFTLDVALEGAGSSLSVNGGKTDINADYKAVGQQSGIFTGDGGFDLEVGGKTTLIGGAITTTDKALELGLNKYVSKGGITTQDIENTSSYEGDAIQVGVSLGMTENKPQANSNGLGYGTDGDSDSSITKGGVSGYNDEQGIFTTDNRAEYAGALENVFDAERVNEELGAQTEITQAFDQERRKIKTELNQDEKKLRDAAKEALENGDRDAWEAYSQEADKIQQKSLLFDGISGALYGPNSNGAVGYVAKAISPQVVYKIGEAFKDNDFENYINGNNELSGVGSSQHLLAHALLGAAVSVATGNDALAGGLGASAGEGTALILSKYIYKVDNPNELTAEQKDVISSIASLTGLALGATTGNVTDAVNAGETALVAAQDNAQKMIWEKLGPRDWHNPDRLFDRAAWNDANEHNITLTQGSKEYKTLAERRAFYGWYANRLEERGIDAQWPRMAWRVVIAAEILEEWNNSPLQNKDLYNMIRSANEAIFNDVFPKLATLENTTSLTGIRAREWDARALAEEQVLVQPIYDKYAGTEAMRIYENAVRQKGTYLPDNFNWDKAGGNRLGMGSFTGDLNKPSNRWAYAMKQMGYTDATPAMMPRVNR